jgi:hypothetical protein
MGAHAANLWAALPAAERQRYKDTRDYLMMKHREEMDRVRDGGTLNLNWMAEAMTDRTELAPVVVNAATAEEEELTDEEEDDTEEEEEEEEE